MAGGRAYDGFTGTYMQGTQSAGSGRILEFSRYNYRENNPVARPIYDPFFVIDVDGGVWLVYEKDLACVAAKIAIGAIIAGAFGAAAVASGGVAAIAGLSALGGALEMAIGEFVDCDKPQPPRPKDKPDECGKTMSCE